MAIRTGVDGLIVQKLLYADEVRRQSELEIPNVDLRQQEPALAEQLIESISVDECNPEAFNGDVQARIQEQIPRQIEGRAIVASEAPTAPGGAQGIDLMQALKTSRNKAPAKPARSSRTDAAQAEKPKPARRASGKRAAKKTA